MNENQDPGDLDGVRQRPPFWARHTKEVKILAVVLVCGVIAGVVPFFVNKYGFHLSAEAESAAEGTCRLQTGFKLDCLPDFSAMSLITATAKTRCAERGCCWDNSTGQAVTCFHQLPSYQYSGKVETIDEDTMSGVVKLGSVLNITDTNLAKYMISSDGCGHVVVDIGSESEGLSPAACSSADPVSILVGCPGFSGPAENPAKECAHHEILTIELTPHTNTSRSSFARTHFGPIMMSEDLSEISFYLTGPRVFGYGMEQFIWSGKREVSHFNFGSSSAVHLPFIVGMHPNQDWFMLWLETSTPGEQIISSGSDQRPIVTWRTMGGPTKVHLLTDESMMALLKKAKEINQFNVPIPPYWTLGYQLCRSVGDPRSFRNDMTGMKTIPFDLDCIDEQMLPTAFTLDKTAFPTFANNLNLLVAEGKDILLSLVVQRTPDSHADGCVQINSTDNGCFEGKFYGESVIYPDPFNAAWMQASYNNLDTDIGAYNIAGWHVHDTGPTNELMQGCQEPRFTPRNMSLDSNLCYDNWIQTVNSSYLAQHSVYSLEVSKSLNQLTDSKYQFAGVHQVSQASVGGFLGSSAPATWAGMGASLREILMLGLAGQSQVSMPVCGTVSSKDQEDVGLLCLRWFQLGSYMASLRSWYSDADNIRMPYNLPQTYQNYITWAMERRYKLLPYLRTLQLDWTNTGVPLVRPMFLQYPSSEFIGLWEQFMVGSDLVVAPIMSEEQQLVSIHLPQGTWYDFNSGRKYISPSDRNVLSVKHKLYEIPVFQRGGSAILLYDSASGMKSAKQVTDAANFELHIGLDCSSSPREQKTLYSCSAKNSQPWVLSIADDYSDYSAAIDVESHGSSGNINIKITGEASASQSDKTLSVVYISGLSLTSAPAVTLPNGVAAEAECTTESEVACLSWQPEQELLLIKNVGIVLVEACVGVEGCNISWKPSV